MRHGTLEVGPYVRGLRRDTYVSHRGERYAEPCHVAGADDTSPRWDKLEHYDPRCGSCWLNHTHSVALHERSLGNVRRLGEGSK